MATGRKLKIVAPESQGETAQPAPPARRKTRLNTAGNVRVELARLYHELRRGEVDSDTARAATFILRSLLESLRLDHFEQRLDELELEVR